MTDYTKFNNRGNNAYGSAASNYDVGMRSYMLNVYNMMTVALLISAFTSFIVASTPALLALLFQVDSANRVIGMSGLGMLFTFAPIGIVLAMGLGLEKFSYNTLRLLFATYAVTIGVSLSTLLMNYTGESVARTFFITASVFGGMSLYGYTTKKDLTGFGSFLMMGLIGIIVMSIVNIFMKSSGLNFALSIISLLVFIGLTAYDTQKIKHIYYEYHNSESVNKLALMGALNLYMDFINIFIQLIRFFGERRD